MGQIQAWLTVVGLIADFAGFCLLLREWWLAFFNEGRQLQMELNLERQRSLRRFAQTNMPDALKGHAQTAARMDEDRAFQVAQSEHAKTRNARKGIFALAAALIVLGFLLQVAGAWPL